MATSQKVVFITTTGAGTYTVPSDFGSLVSVECIGGGGSGGGALSNYGGGGGGAYSKTTTLALLKAGSVANYQVGTTATDTWFNWDSSAGTSSATAPTSDSTGVLAKGGVTATTTTGAAGGAAASGFPSNGIRYSGGSGGTATTGPGGGGGGAAGPSGNGANGGNGGSGVGGGGGGANGGTNASGATAGVGFSGGGSGGAGNATSAGGAGTYWTQTSNSATAGPGGGSGTTSGGTAGAGGLYGGGGADAASGGGVGAQGIIVFTYKTPVQFLSREGDLETLFVTDYAMIDQYASTGSLWLWGYNDSAAAQAGVLGDNTSVSKSSPVQTVSGGTNWKQVAAGLYHAAAIKTDGTLWTWGYNSTGTLGDGSSIVNKSSPIQTVSGGTNWKQVAGGQSHAAAIKTDGTLWTWGYNAQGQVGDNSITHRSSPIQTVSGGTNWKLVAGGKYHTVAIKTDGTLWLWGYNSGGQLGDNTSTHRSSPVQTIAGGTNWKSVSGGSAHTVAIKTDGTLWTWGQNTLGQLGDNTRINKFSPVQTIAGGTNWKSVSSGIAYTAAIKTDGTLWLWGHNNYGQLGDNTIVHRSSPVQTVSGGTNWKQVAGGGFNIASIKTDGTLWTWAYNAQGQLGDNTIVHRSSPIQTVSGGTNWKLVAAGQQHTSAIFFYEAGKLYPPS